MSSADLIVLSSDVLNVTTGLTAEDIYNIISIIISSFTICLNIGLFVYVITH